MEASAQFAGRPADVSEVRRFLRAAMSGAADEDLMDVVSLMASELAANAVLHARTDVEVTVRWSERQAWVGVKDGTRLPQPGHAPPDATSGRGLQIIDALSSHWGAERCPSGKVVWFEVAVGAPPRRDGEGPGNMASALADRAPHAGPPSHRPA